MKHSGSYQVPDAAKESTRCDNCGATIRLNTGLCVACLLREGLDSDNEVSQADYGNVLAEADAPAKHWFLGNYKILEQIGCGGMGVIYRARQRHSRRIVAIKRVLSYRADSRGALERFRREAQAVASLDHPNILPIYEVNESEDGLPFFSMKFAEKGSLRENIASLHNEPPKCVQLMAKVARAVEYAHSRGVLHRDLKPGNILLDDRNEPLVSDFGLAKLVDANNDLTRSLTTFGTAGFIAPEQAGGAAADFTPAADVYSLGAVLFNLLAGRPPFLGSNPVSVIREASETPPPKLRSLAPTLDRDLETICARCLERDPNARYKSASDLAGDLEHWLVGRPIVARPVSVPTRVWRWSRRNPRLVGAGVAGLLLGATAVWLFSSEVFQPPQFHPPDKSIAVLPFVSLNTTKDQQHLGDGVSEEILNSLANLDGLHVVGRTSSFSFPGNANATDVGKRLNVAHVLEGSLRREGNRIRVTAELIDASSGFRLWTETYDREMEGLFALQDEIAHAIVESLKIKFAVPISAHERPSERVQDSDIPQFFKDVTRPTGINDFAINMPLQDAFGPPPAVPDPLDRTDARVSAALPVREASPTTSVPTRESQADVKTKKIAVAPIVDRQKAGATATSIQGFVKASKGEPVKDADVRIESRDGKELITTVKTDAKGRYISDSLQPGVYRVTLLVDGMVKASIMNTRTKANQSTQLNFDLKPASQAAKIAKGGKHLVWMPGRTGSHIGGGWVEVDDRGKAHSSFNVQRVTARNW